VIVKKSKPPLARIAAAQNLSQIPSHTSFRDAEPEFLEFTVDPRRSPVRIFIRQASDEYANLFRDLWSTALRPGTPSPIVTAHYDHLAVRGTWSWRPHL